MATCFERLKDIGKGVYSDEEIKQILSDAKEKLSVKEAVGAGSEEVVRQAIKEGTENLEKRVDLESVRTRQEELQVARNLDIFEPFLKLKRKPLNVFVDSLTIGQKTQVPGSKARNMAAYHVVQGDGEMIRFKNTLDKVQGGLQWLKGGQNDIAITDAINGKETPDKIANALGKELRELDESKDKEFAVHGISTKKLKDRGAKQSHDPQLMLRTDDTIVGRQKIFASLALKPDRAELQKDISFKRWFNDMDKWLDLGRTFGSQIANNLKDRLKLQRKIYDKLTDEGTQPGTRTIQSQQDLSRFYHFNDASSQLNYSKKYGIGGLYDNLMNEAKNFGNKIATLELAGNDPLKTIRKTIEELGKNFPERFSKEDVKVAQARADFRMRQALGSSTRVLGASGQLVEAIKMANAMRILPTIGPIVLINDQASAINELARVGGTGAVKATIKFWDIVRRTLISDPELENFVQGMELRRDLFLGSHAKHTGLKDSRLRNKMMRFLMKFSPHEFMNWTEGLSAVHELTLQLGQRSKLKLNEMPEFMARTLRLYGIDSDSWDLIRKGAITTGKRTHITADALRNVDRGEVADFLRKTKGVRRVSEARIDRELRNAQQLFLTMTSDRMSVASNRVGTQQRAFFDIGERKDLPAARKFANVWSLVGSLRMYETGILQKTLAPIIYGEYGETVAQSILSGNFGWRALSRWAGIGISYGVIGFTVRSLLEGEVPNPEMILTRSALSVLGVLGPGLEISNRPGHTALDTVAGPGLTIPGKTLQDIYGIFTGPDRGGKAVDALTQIVPPFNNTIFRNAIHHFVQHEYGNMNG